MSAGHPHRSTLSAIAIYTACGAFCGVVAVGVFILFQFLCGCVEAYAYGVLRERLENWSPLGARFWLLFWDMFAKYQMDGFVGGALFGAVISQFTESSRRPLTIAIVCASILGTLGIALFQSSPIRVDSFSASVDIAALVLAGAVNGFLLVVAARILENGAAFFRRRQVHSEALL